MAVRKEKTLRVPYAYAQAYEIALAALNGIGAVIQQHDSNNGVITATMGVSIQSFGEIISVQVRPINETQTDIRIESASSVATTMFDWGKNQQNLNAFEARFAQLAAQPTPSAANLPVVSAPDPFDFLADMEVEEVEDPTSETRAASAIPTSAAPMKQADAEKPRTHRVFISYRRSDSIDITGRMYDRLVRDFGEGNVFKDVDNIPFGVDFAEYLDNKVKECSVLLAVIGPGWMTAVDERGRRRIDDPNDFVRVEIELGLKRQMLVVPVLVGGAEMPYTEDLPESLRPLTRRNGISIRPDPDFHTDMTRLIKRL